MTDGTQFHLKVTAYSPETIPMARLAEYLSEFAALLGSQESVRFRGVSKGSTVLNAEVPREVVPKVEMRLRDAAAHGRSDQYEDVQKVISRIEGMLRADNARGLVLEGRESVLEFLGVDAVIPERIGPVHEATAVEGEVQRVGGADKTLHALLLTADGQTHKLTTRSRELAKRLAMHLFGQVRANGTGVWFRNEQGGWELDELKLEDFEPVTPRSLIEAVSELRSVGGSGWRKLKDPLATARALRKH